MWAVATSISLLPVVIMVSSRLRVKACSLCHRAQAWARWLIWGRVCVTSTHAFVFSKCTHGKPDSVLETFDLYSKMYPSVCIGPQAGEVLDDVMRRVGPSMVLELGMHCAYSSVRLLRLLPPGGRLVTVEMDPFTADLGEEIILVAGFKDQFQVLPLSSAEAIPSLHGLLAPHAGGFSLVLMDHDPAQYLKDLLSLEAEGLLRPTGCSIILIHRDRRAGSVRRVLDYIRTRAQCYQIKTQIQTMIEICYKSAGTMVE